MIKPTFKINKAVLIYFAISWLLGILILISSFYKNDMFMLFWFFAAAFNAVINLIVLIFLSVLALVFTENKKEFVTSIILLTFNFPFIVGSIVLINLLWE